MDQVAFKKRLQYQVMNQLRPKKRNVAATGQILIKQRMLDQLKEDFGVTGRYTHNEELMEHLNLTMSRQLNRTEQCFCKKVRVSNEKKLSYLDENLCERKLSSGYCTFWYRFIKYEKTS